MKSFYFGEFTVRPSIVRWSIHVRRNFIVYDAEFCRSNSNQYDKHLEYVVSTLLLTVFCKRQNRADIRCEVLMTVTNVNLWKRFFIADTQISLDGKISHICWNISETNAFRSTDCTILLIVCKILSLLLYFSRTTSISSSSGRSYRIPPTKTTFSPLYHSVQHKNIQLKYTCSKSDWISMDSPKTILSGEKYETVRARLPFKSDYKSKKLLTCYRRCCWYNATIEELNLFNIDCARCHTLPDLNTWLEWFNGWQVILAKVLWTVMHHWTIIIGCVLRVNCRIVIFVKVVFRTCQS